MPRCPKCDSKDVYRHTRWSRRRQFICRNCMSDLIESNSGFLSPSSIALFVCIFAEVLALLLLALPPTYVVICGISGIFPAMFIASVFETDLEVVPRPCEPLPGGGSERARAVWFGLRRRNDKALP